MPLKKQLILLRCYESAGATPVFVSHATADLAEFHACWELCCKEAANSCEPTGPIEEAMAEKYGYKFEFIPDVERIQVWY